MKSTYCKYDQHIIVEENGKFGIEDKSGHLLLPIEYDRIIVACGIKDGIGFILSKNGRFGYVEFGAREHLEEYENGVVLGDPNGCALAFLPCMYDWIEAKRNGLAIYSESEEDIKDLWYDYKSRTLYRQVRYQDNLGNFDVLIDFSHGPCVPEIKKAGVDEWVRFPKDCGVEPWREIPLDTVGVKCILCMEEKSSEDDEDGTIDGYEYFFLLLYKNGWMPSPAKRTLAELYAELPAIMEGIENHKNGRKEESKQGYTLLCKYKKRNEVYDYQCSSSN